jgi:hypothetical protein
MTTEYTFHALDVETPRNPRPVFDNIICYERRDLVHTSRWVLEGLSTRSDAPGRDGWLWLSTLRNGDAFTAQLWADREASLLLAQGSGTLDDFPAQVDLTSAAGSTVSGRFWLESAGQGSDARPVLATLCTDEDLAQQWADLEELGQAICDPIYGLARYCATATRQTLLLVSQLYSNHLGGVGAREDRRLPRTGRFFPDYRRISCPEQLKDVATYWALETALRARHQHSEPSAYSRLGDHFAALRKRAVSAWDLTLNLQPDTDDDADTSRAAGVSHPQRL